MVRAHPCTVKYSGTASLAKFLPRVTHQFQRANFLALAFSLLLAAPVQVAESAMRPSGEDDSTPSIAATSEIRVDPPGLLYQGIPARLPQDQGVAGLRLALLRLGTTARLMQTVAHPDDEDGGMLTLDARGHGVNTLLMTLTRGEGGQNKVGSNLSDVLGVLRALELLASDENYGVQQRFSRVADFGFSKTAQETFEKWGGHDVALADIVRVMRTFRPDVVTTRFSGTERDGHGNHQVSGILAQEAFRAAADPKRFPEQIAAGLEPWQAKKVYIGNVCGFGATTCPDAAWTVKLNTGERGATLGGSYVQFAVQGLRHQLSQGAGGWSVEPGDRFTFYKLMDSALSTTPDKHAHEKDFFDGIDTTLPGLAAGLGVEEKKVPRLRRELTEIAAKIGEASAAANGKDPAAAAIPLADVADRLERASTLVSQSALGAAAKLDLLTRLKEKQEQAETALNLALSVNLTADVGMEAVQDIPPPREAAALTAVSPGEEFPIAVKLHNGSKQTLTIEGVKLEVPQGWNTLSDKTRPVTVKPDDNLLVKFRLRVPPDAAFTRPYWHRDDPDRESLHHVDDEQYATLPFPPPALRARVEYSIGGTGGGRHGISTAVVTPFLDEGNARRSRPLAIVPGFSVVLEPGTQVISTHNGSSSKVTVAVTSNLTRAMKGVVRLELPSGWQSEPAQAAVEFARRGEKQEVEFTVHPASLQEGRAEIHAVLEAEDQKYREGYTLVTREDLGSFYYYQPARQGVSIVDVQVPHDLKVGYIMGAGDDIPTVLKQVGMDVTLIPADSLASADLGAYKTIVLGIRAYDTQKDLATNNKKLLDWVSAGGTLVVQYNASVGEFNSGHFTPYPAQMSRARVSVEEAAVEVLAPADGVFHSPNTITARDFDGWVQERGLYFMDQWDEHFKPLLACHDPGEEAQKGGMLRAQYGQGVYIFTGYAFFRQLPAGVPGAVRLYVNLLSAGHEGEK